MRSDFIKAAIRSFMSLLSHGVYFCLWGLGFLVLKTPLQAKRVFASVFAFVFLEILGFRRQVVFHNLARVFPRKKEESMSEFERRIKKLAFKNFIHYGWMFLELFERFHWSEEIVKKKLKATGVENVWNALAKGKGFFFLTAHLGNWELITRVGVFLKFPLVIVTKALRNPFWDAVWVRSRKSFGLELLEESGSGLGIVRCIRSNKGVGFILDQHTGPPHGDQAEFLGVKNAWCPKGLAILASRLDCPVIPAYMVRDANGCFHLTIEPALDLPQVKTDADRITHIEICNRNMEKWILQYPEQYLWIHKRFKGQVDYSTSLPWEL